MKHLLYFCFCVLLPMRLSFAQIEPLRCELIGQEQGLPDDSAWSLLEDHLGLLWIGTQLGLARYDGHQVKAFDFESADPSYKHILPNYNARTIAEGPNGDIWIGTARREVFRFVRKTEQFVPVVVLKDGKVQGTQASRKIVVDRQGNVWLAVGEKGLSRLQGIACTDWSPEDTTVVLQEFPQSGSGSPGKIIWDLCLDAEKNLWIVGDQGLVRWMSDTDQFQIYPFPDTLVGQRAVLPILDLKLAPDGALWMSAWDRGALKFDPVREDFEHLPIHYDDIKPKIFQIHVDQKNRIWLFDGGDIRERILIYDRERRRFAEKDLYYTAPLRQVPRLDLISIIEDRAGLIWIANHLGGLLKYRPETAVFQWIRPPRATDDELGLNTARQVYSDQESTVWISTRAKGLVRWHPDDHTFRSFRHQVGNPNHLSSDVVYGVCEPEDRKSLWIATGNGLDVLDKASGRVIRINEQPDAPDALKNRLYTSIVSDRQGGFWLLSNREGVEHYDPGTRNHQIYAKGGDDNRIRVINGDELFLDSHGKLWIGASNTFFFRFDPETEELRHFEFPPGGDFWEDEQETVWVGTYGAGLVGVDMNDMSIRRYTREDGLTHDKVRSIMHDANGHLWVGTNYGLVHFDPDTGTSRHFFERDGLPANEFLTQTATLLADGRMVFGTNGGLFLFHPDSINIDTLPPEVVLQEVLIGGVPLAEARDDRTLTFVSDLKELQVRHWENDISLRFAANNFRNPELNEYEIRLENFRDEWVNIGNQHTASYPNLDPGKYRFQVRAANSDGIWSESFTTLELHIMSPWYWNAWSKTLYIAATLGSILAFYRFQLNRRLALAETARLRELDEVKSRLYTNITHEFRTPLTVIQGTTEQIREHETEKEIIQRNSRQLLDMVNRLLDLSKLEAGKLELQLVQGDIITFLSYVTESFHSLALNQKINLNFYTGDAAVVMDHDPEKILQIMSNLISNALKFTAEYGKVTITAHRHVGEGGEELLVRVSDTGVGISPEQLPKIFDRFHQVDNSTTHKAEPLRRKASAPVEGTGIGLALCRELIELMDGRIEVESEAGEGSCFSFYLPVRQEAPLAETIEELHPALVLPVPDAEEELKMIPAEGKTSDTELPILLIVEDNRDVRQYLASCLRADYQLLFARNGREGIEQAREHIPDIIISDVMMPEVDGYELCRAIKQDERTSHVPIILLTAKADMESRIEGLEYGADAYLTKPFHQSELEVRLRKLIALRRQLQIRYSRPGFGQDTAPHHEDAFVLKVRQLVLDHLDEAAFDVEALSDALHLHRSQLHRKLKALTGLSTTHFIRRVRLQEGYRLLEEGELNVSEVAYAVGFSDPSYFSKLFSKAYGRPPSTV